MEHTSTRALLPQSPYKKRTLKPYHIKYYGLIAVFLMMIAAIKVFINYATIQTSIEQVMKETISISRHKQYVALQSYVFRLPEAEQFISHDNGIVLPGERVFMKVIGTGTTMTGAAFTGLLTQQEISERALSPITSRIEYFSKKMSR